MALEVVNTTVGEVALGRERLRIIAEERRCSRLIRRFAFEVAVVLDLQRPMGRQRPSRGRPIAALEHHRAVFAEQTIVGVAIDEVVVGAEVDAVADHLRGAIADLNEVVDHVRGFALHVGGLGEAIRSHLSAKGQCDLFVDGRR
jgi:hypothetical protein